MTSLPLVLLAVIAGLMLVWLVRKVHIHHDPNWQLHGCWRYYRCECGARRVVRAYSNLMGPVADGWQGMTVDSHGVSRDDSGWRRD